jgi:two-component system LytT family response regulator
VIRVLVVDDEPLARRGIEARLERWTDIEVVGTCASGREAVAAIRAHAPDLVFLDVQMPGGDGFSVIRQIGPDRMPLVVFVTAYDAHAVRAFEVHALDYLLKPIDDDRFARALERVRARLADRRHQEIGRRLASLIGDEGAAGHSNAPALETRIAVRDRDRTVLVDVDDLDWLGADGDYVRLYVGGRGLMLRETLGGMESRLDPRRFVRIHRSTIVNTTRVKELRALPNGEQIVLLRDGTQLRLSRTYRDRVDRLLGGSR